MKDEEADNLEIKYMIKEDTSMLMPGSLKKMLVALSSQYWHYSEDKQGEERNSVFWVFKT